MAVPMPPSNSVWTAMNYVPPRGRCNFRAGIVSGTCSCLRFMLHPVKAATSFECDGCSHHASYHTMDNPGEDEIVKRWATEQRATEQRAIDSGPTTMTENLRNKRRRITNGTDTEGSGSTTSQQSRQRVLDLT